MRLGLPDHLVETHPGGIEIEVKVKVNVEVEARGNREDLRDMAVRVGVGIGTAANQIGAVLAGCDQQLFSAGIIDQAFLRKDADLEVDRPGVVLLKTLDGVEARHGNARVDLDMRTHARRALDDRLLEGSAGAP